MEQLESLSVQYGVYEAHAGGIAAHFMREFPVAGGLVSYGAQIRKAGKRLLKLAIVAGRKGSLGPTKSKRQERRRHFEAEYLGGLEIDDKVELGGLKHRLGYHSAQQRQRWGICAAVPDIAVDHLHF
jgi:hypothetical protein